MLYNNERLDKAGALLSIFSADQIEDIVALANARGRGLVADLGGPDNPYEVPPFMAILSRAYMRDADARKVLIGFGTLVLAAMKTNKLAGSKSYYAEVLGKAYNLPTSFAAAIASKIETEDILGATMDDPTGANQGTWSAIKNSIVGTAKTLANQVLSLPGISMLGISLEQNQEYDLDALYEWSLLGDAVTDLNRRTRLMKASAMIQTTSGMLGAAATGDVDGDVEDGDVQWADMHIGDMLQSSALRRMPNVVYGPYANLAGLGAQAQSAQAATAVQEAGYSKNASGQVVKTSSPRTALGRAMNKILGGSVGKTAGIAFAGGAAVPLIAGMISAMKSRGDVEAGDVQDELENAYGSSMAEALQHAQEGDIDPLIAEFADLAVGDLSTGNAEIDQALRAANEDEYGDLLSEGDPEVGGLFSRMRANMAMRRRIKHQGRRFRKSTRAASRAQRKEDKLRARLGKRGAVTSDYRTEAPAYEEQEESDGGYQDPGTQESYDNSPESQLAPDEMNLSGDEMGLDQFPG